MCELVYNSLLAKGAKNYTPNPIFLIMAEAYMSATFGQNNLDIFDLCVHWASVVRDFNPSQNSLPVKISELCSDYLK